jgi:hypothetical protein
MVILVPFGGRVGVDRVSTQTTRWVPGRQSWSATLPVAPNAAICGGPTAADRGRQSLPRVPVPNAAPVVQAAGHAGRYPQQTVVANGLWAR